jgi:hypothetical protein
MQKCSALFMTPQSQLKLTSATHLFLFYSIMVVKVLQTIEFPVPVAPVGI